MSEEKKIIIDAKDCPMPELTEEEKRELDRLEKEQRERSQGVLAPERGLPAGQESSDPEERILWEASPVVGRVVPRQGLSEKNFKLFESVIARAINEGGFVIDPRMIETKGSGMSARTFVTKMLDAMLGYEKLGYRSFELPPVEEFKAMRKFIKPLELDNGLVRVVYTMKESLDQDKPERFKASNSRLLTKLINEYSSVTYIKSFDYEGKFPIIVCASQEEVDLVVSKIRKARVDLVVTFSKKDGGLKVMPK